MDCSPPGFSVHGILLATILEWVLFSFPPPRNLRVPLHFGLRSQGPFRVGTGESGLVLSGGMELCFPDAWKDLGQEEKGTTEDEMVGWHHRLNGHGFG